MIGRILTAGLGSFGSTSWILTAGLGAYSGATPDPVFTRRITLIGASAEAVTWIGAPAKTKTYRGAPQRTIEMEGASR